MNITKPLLFILFSLSGFAGLIYESIWSHYVKLLLGHAAYAQTLVLSIFMGGLALGAWLISRVSTRVKNPLLWYALIEATIGLFGLLFHREFLLAKDILFLHALPAIDSPGLASLAKWSVATLLLLPQAILLGATFPLMSAAVIRFDRATSGRTLGMLYFTNSIGAVVGVLLSGFFLIEKFGLPGTSFTAGMVNISLAIFIWPLVRELTHTEPVVEAATRNELAGGLGLLSSIAFLTGLASFFYEIGWIRMLSLVLGSSNQAFELMLSAFILGLALGSFFIRNQADNTRNIIYLLAWIQIFMGVAAAATLPMYTQSFAAMGFLRDALALTDQGYSLFNVGSHVIAMAIMLPATFMAGMTLPLLTNGLLRAGYGERAIGRIYAANTLGAIVGIVLAINILMPIAGVKNLIVAGALVDILAGFVLLARFKQSVTASRWRILPAAAALVAVVMLGQISFDEALLSSGVYRFGRTSLGERIEPIFYRDGKTATIAVIEHANGAIGIRTNGKTDALIHPENKPHSSDEVTMVLAAALPLSFNPEARDAANIGMGSGLTTHALLATDTIETVDSVEIEKAMVEGARYFGTRVARTFDDERSRIYIDDAKSFFSTIGRQYDIIVSEPSNPWVSGVASLFTQEFYEHITKHLKPKGLFVQWLQLYETNLNNIGSVIEALNAVFVDYRIYNTDDANILIIASSTATIPDPDPWIFTQPALKDELARAAIDTIDDLSIRYVGNKDKIAKLFPSKASPVNSDYYPYLSYRAPRSFFKRENAIEIPSLHTAPLPVLFWVNGTAPIEALSESGRYFTTYDKYAAAKDVIDLSITARQSGRIVFAIRRVADRLIRCQVERNPDKTLQDALFTIAAAVNPYLSQRELTSFWHGLANACPVTGLTSAEGDWLDLHSAIGRRDLGGVADSAGRIFDGGQSLERHEYYYLLAATLASLYASDRQVETVSALQRHLDIDRYDAFPFYLKYLVGLVLPD